MRSADLSECVSEANIIVDKPGRGSNWAYGFYDNERRTSPEKSSQRPQDARQSRPSSDKTTVSNIRQGEPGTTAVPSRLHTASSTSRQHPSPSLSSSTLKPSRPFQLLHEDDPSLLERAMDAIRREASRCDLLCGFVLIHSIAGGTGSGLGSRITKELRNQFAREFILSVVVAPHRSGETALQNYNAVLCLEVLNQYADAILLLENDLALRVLSEVAVTASAASTASASCDSASIANAWSDSMSNSSQQDHKPITLNDINQYFARGLACLLSPMNMTTMGSSKSLGHRRIELWDICANITAVPGCKFFQMYSITTRKESTVTVVDLFAKLQKNVSRRIGESEQVIQLQQD